MPRGHRNLSGKSVLVIEDEFMIAMDYAMYLEAMGARVVGPVSSVPQALDMLREQNIDAAVLDIDLQGTKAFMVADALIERRIGFVFASGYDDVVIPERFSAVIRCGKPAKAADVADALQRVCFK
ncbi:MAG: response regulator [Hyphomicrobium sp.]|nr:response regulator [Hyphomicrobium sp.]